MDSKLIKVTQSKNFRGSERKKIRKKTWFHSPWSNRSFVLLNNTWKKFSSGKLFIWPITETVSHFHRRIFLAKPLASNFKFEVGKQKIKWYATLYCHKNVIKQRLSLIMLSVVSRALRPLGKRTYIVSIKWKQGTSSDWSNQIFCFW